MTADADAYTFSVAGSLAEVDPAEWDACAVGGDEAEPDNPFLRHAFLHALEASGSAAPRNGWAGAHGLLRDAGGRLVGCVPAYLKNHSRGEYVFDAGWADAFERAGGRYYPKLQVSVPFTPATGRRLLVPAGPDREDVERLLARVLVEAEGALGASSTHLTFVTEGEAERLRDAGFLHRTDQQFHWIDDQGFASFDEFLETLQSRKRKAIRRERREALSPGIAIELLTGSDIREAHLDAFFAFYTDTGSRKWGRPYLTRAFFSLVVEAMAERVLLVMAKRGGRYVAGAINFIGATTLYGRHWGAVEEHPFLHFEVCYHQAIEFAISRGLRRVEAGAQGEHKLARGYRPVTTHSLHHIAHPGFRRAVASYLDSERAHVAELSEELATLTPFRRETS